MYSLKDTCNPCIGLVYTTFFLTVNHFSRIIILFMVCAALQCYLAIFRNHYIFTLTDQLCIYKLNWPAGDSWPKPYLQELVPVNGCLPSHPS